MSQNLPQVIPNGGINIWKERGIDMCKKGEEGERGLESNKSWRAPTGHRVQLERVGIFDKMKRYPGRFLSI